MCSLTFDEEGIPIPGDLAVCVDAEKCDTFSMDGYIPNEEGIVEVFEEWKVIICYKDVPEHYEASHIRNDIVPEYEI